MYFRKASSTGLSPLTSPARHIRIHDELLKFRFLSQEKHRVHGLVSPRPDPKEPDERKLGRHRRAQTPVLRMADFAPPPLVTDQAVRTCGVLVRSRGSFWPVDGADREG